MLFAVSVSDTIVRIRVAVWANCRLGSRTVCVAEQLATESHDDEYFLSLLAHLKHLPRLRQAVVDAGSCCGNVAPHILTFD